MDDDKLLRDLGRLAAEDEADDDPRRETWDRLVRNELSSAEIAELEALAATDDDVKQKLAVFRPLEADTRSTITSRIAEHVAEPPRQSTSGTEKADVVALGSWKPRAYAFVTALAIAAAVLLFVRRSPEIAPLPPYLVEASGASTARGPSTAPGPSSCVLNAADRGSFELVARAHDGEAGVVKATAYVVRSGGLHSWPGNVEVAPTGAVRIVGPRKDLAGATELRLFVEREGALSSADGYAKVREGAGAGPGWQVVTCSVAGSTLD